MDIECLQEDINSLFNWTINNLLSFNLSKFVFMSYHHKFNPSYNVNGHSIDESPSCKDLGIIFTNWQAHYEMITSKVYKSLGLLRRPYLLKDIESLVKVQRRATKFILSNYQSDYKTRLIQFGILPLMLYL